MAKGVSPLVASVLLIAATMALAGILAFWSSGFIRGQTVEFENKTATLKKCTGADFQIYSYTRYNTSTHNVTIILVNKADFVLQITEVDLFYPNGTIAKQTVNQTLPAGNAFISVPLSGVDDGYEKFIVLTDCPTVTKEAAYK